MFFRLWRGSYRGIFVIRDYLFLFFMNREFCVNSSELFFVFHDQMVVRAPRKTRINNRYPWYYFLFFPDDFQFQDFRKINKENESIKWEWWIFVICYLQSCFFFSTLSSCFSGTLLTIFSLRENKIKNGTLHAEYVTRKLKWRFAILDSWFVTILVRELCQKPLMYDPL